MWICAAGPGLVAVQLEPAGGLSRRAPCAQPLTRTGADAQFCQRTGRRKFARRVDWAAARTICRRSCGRAVQPSPSRVLVSRVLVRSEPSREPEEQSQDPSRATPHKRETNSLIDGPGPRATSGQGRAYSAARGDRDSPDRPAPSANNSPPRCTISKPRRRNLTLHSKIARPSKCSYRLKCFRRSWFLVVSYPARGAHKHYTSNNRLAEVRFPCAKSLSIDLPPNELVNAACSLDARSPLHRNSFYARSIWVRCDAQPRNTGAQF